MLDTILLLVVTALVFGLFFLVFLLKGASKDRPVRFHNCGNCNCQRSESREGVINLEVPAGQEKPCRSEPSDVS